MNLIYGLALGYRSKKRRRGWLAIDRMVSRWLISSPKNDRSQVQTGKRDIDDHNEHGKQNHEQHADDQHIRPDWFQHRGRHRKRTPSSVHRRLSLIIW